jgi:hypothetical protein
MIGDNFKEMTKYHDFSDFSLCAEPLTAKTANLHNAAVENWNIKNEDGSESFKSVSKAFGYELLARVGNVFLFPAALLDAIFHVAVGAFTLIAAIPEKIYLLKKSRSEQGLEAEAENIEGNVANRKFTFAGACNNFESAVKYVGVAIFGTIAGVLFDPQAAADMARAGHKQLIAELIAELNVLTAEKSDAEDEAELGNENQGIEPRNNLVEKSVLENAQARIANLENELRTLADEKKTDEEIKANFIDRQTKSIDQKDENITQLALEIQDLNIQNDTLKVELRKSREKLKAGRAEVKEEKEVYSKQSQVQTNTSPRAPVSNNNNSPRNSDLHDEDAGSKAINTDANLTITIESKAKEETQVLEENQVDEKKEKKVSYTVDQSQYITLDDKKIEEKVALIVEESISVLKEEEEILSSSGETK